MNREVLEGARYCINTWRNCYSCLLDDGEVSCVEVFAKTIIDHHEKYRWHDLRKNPTDLPPDDYGEYECVELWDDGDTLHTMAYGHYIRHHAVTKTLHDIAVIAWREIDLFEPEESDGQQEV